MCAWGLLLPKKNKKNKQTNVLFTVKDSCTYTMVKKNDHPHLPAEGESRRTEDNERRRNMGRKVGWLLQPYLIGLVSSCCEKL